MQSASELIGKGHNSVLLLGAPKVGKTTFTCSGSRHAETLVMPENRVMCDDVLLISLDAEGFAGAIGSGYEPLVKDLSGLKNFHELNRAIAGTIVEAKRLVDAGKLSIVGIDLGALSTFTALLAAGDAGGSDTNLTNLDVDFSAQKVNWNMVAAMGAMVYRALRVLNCTVVGMAHPKLTDNNHYLDSSNATADAKEKHALKRDSGAVGGVASKLSADLYKGIMTPWAHNASHIFARDVKLVEQPGHTFRNPKVKKEFMTHLHSNETYSVGTRFASKLPASTDKSLRWILDQCRSVTTGEAA